MSSSPPIQLPFNYKESVKLISAVVGLVLLFFGIYMLGPWYVVVPGGAFAETSQMSLIYFKVVAAGHALAGAGMFFSAFRRHNIYTRTCSVLAVSMFSVMLVTRLASIGLVPTIWVLQLGLMLIAAVLSLTAEGDN